MKKLISILLAVIFIMIIPINIAASGSFVYHTDDNDNNNYDNNYVYTGTYENLEYGVKNGEVIIIGYLGDGTETVVIPEAIDGYPVTEIGYEAFYYSEIKSISMPYIKAIEDRAFAHCNNLTIVRMQSVLNVFDEAFLECENLTTVAMPEVDFISDNAFALCESLNNFVAPKVTFIGKCAFEGCTSLK